jgi:8-oxo-dGTP pyrophosphatase MutT (NUDIX family)
MTYLDNDAKKLLKTYPKFADGRVDYHGQKICYATLSIVTADNKFLLTRRSNQVAHYQNKLDVVAGYLDQPDLSIEESARIELAEEIAAPLDEIKDTKVVGPVIFVDDVIDREWRDYYVFFEFARQFQPKLNWENSAAGWYSLGELEQLQNEMIPKFYERLVKVLNRAIN